MRTRGDFLNMPGFRVISWEELYKGHPAEGGKGIHVHAAGAVSVQTICAADAQYDDRVSRDGRQVFYCRDTRPENAADNRALDRVAREGGTIQYYVIDRFTGLKFSGGEFRVARADGEGVYPMTRFEPPPPPPVATKLLSSRTKAAKTKRANTLRQREAEAKRLKLAPVTAFFKSAPTVR